jgi:hypothetical protein
MANFHTIFEIITSLFSYLPGSLSILFPGTTNQSLMLDTSQPMTQERATPPPLRAPLPWIWQCHECYTEYPLSCTRRCLECSHQFCAAVTPTKARSKRRRSKLGRRRFCAAEFDYDAWEAWGAFRRTAAVQAAATAKKGAITARLPTSRKRRRVGEWEDVDSDKFATWELRRGLTTGSVDGHHSNDVQSGRSVWRPVAEAERDEVASRKERMYVQGRHNCWLHCDFPSECFHAIHVAWAEGRISAGDW